MNNNTAAASAAAATNTPKPPPPEDAANESGGAIDTFSGYIPTALPTVLLQCWKDNTKSSTAAVASLDPSSTSSTVVEEKKEETTASIQKQQQEQDAVIEILDDSLDSFPQAQQNDTTMDFTSLKLPSHTCSACESALLASVTAPRASNHCMDTLQDLVAKHALSPLQWEGVSLCITRHYRLLYSAKDKQFVRAGFFLGDAAGIGKGRQISAVLRDSLSRGRGRHLWLSVSRDLLEDAKRDLRDVGCHVNVYDDSVLSTKQKGLGSSSYQKGVLFCTYALLISGQGRRMRNIMNWLCGGASPETFEGCIVFDEAHKAKNLQADTQTAKLVVELQQSLPKARVLYCSATGVSDLHHLSYATRLGLWGAGSSMYTSFNDFFGSIKNRGVGSLELLACELKQSSSLVARTLSWEGAEFTTLEISLSESACKMYNGAVVWWNTVQKALQEALQKVGGGHANLWRAYWSAHQRFFREMAICAKVERVIQECKHHFQLGHAVVIGLQSTGEASTEAALEEMNITLDKNMDDVVLPSLLSTARSTMVGFLKNHFPTAPEPPTPPPIPPLPEGASRELRAQHEYMVQQMKQMAHLPPPPPLPELVARQQALVDAAHQLVLPPNPLDDLIDQLGGQDEVAELTGRSGRILKRKGQYCYVKRMQAPASAKFGLSMPSREECDTINLGEKKKFMDGRKSVAIISDAASTGISLHAAKGSGASHKRRVHFTIELPWAADKAIQQLGRSHRSGELSAPIYKMCVTDLGGERRFGAAVSKRMASLGALTKGDRRAATGSDLSEFDIDSVYGKRALTRVYQCLLISDGEAPTTAPSRHGHAILDEYAQQCGMQPTEDESMRRVYALSAAQQAMRDVGLASNDIPKKAEVKVFLNRIAGIPVLEQKLVFALFMSTLDDVVADAKATGEFEGSVEDVKATDIELDGAPEKLAVDKRSGAATTLTRFKLDRGISLETVAAQSLEDATIPAREDIDDGFGGVAESGFYVSKRSIAGRQLVLYAKRKVEPNADTTSDYIHDPLGLMVITRPNTGKNPCPMPTRELRIKYHLLLSSNGFCQNLKDEEEDSNKDETAVDALRRKYPKVARLWDDAYSDSYSFDHNLGLAPRRSRLGLVTGTVLHVLPALEKAVVFRGQSERALRVARIEVTASGERIVGIRFPVDDEVVGKLKTVLSDLEVGKDSAEVVLFKDEPFTPVDPKSMTWATTERKTMRSFFSVASNGTNKVSGSKRKENSSPDSVAFSPANATSSQAKKNGSSAAKPTKSAKKTKSIKSFFSAK